MNQLELLAGVTFPVALSEEVLAVGAQAEALVQRVGAALDRELARAHREYMTAGDRYTVANRALDEARSQWREAGRESWAEQQFARAQEAARETHIAEMRAAGYYRGVQDVYAAVQQALETGTPLERQEERA